MLYEVITEIGLIPHIGNAAEFITTGSDALQDGILLRLVRNFRDHNRGFSTTDILYVCF